MNCSASEVLLLRAQDGALSEEERAALGTHLSGCAVCREFAAALDKVPAAVQTESGSVALPDVDAAWAGLQVQLPDPPLRPARKRRLAPLVWLGAPLAAAAALALVFLAPHHETAVAEAASTDHDFVTHVDYVETGDPKASTIVYVDQDSGWLVVWMESAPTNTSG